MRYALIAADGEMQIKTGDWQAELGPHGYDRVRLRANRHQVVGWVSDCGLIMPDVYRVSAETPRRRTTGPRGIFGAEGEVAR